MQVKSTWYLVEPRACCGACLVLFWACEGPIAEGVYVNSAAVVRGSSTVADELDEEGSDVLEQIKADQGSALLVQLGRLFRVRRREDKEAGLQALRIRKNHQEVDYDSVRYEADAKRVRLDTAEAVASQLGPKLDELVQYHLADLVRFEKEHADVLQLVSTFITKWQQHGEPEHNTWIANCHKALQLTHSSVPSAPSFFQYALCKYYGLGELARETKWLDFLFNRAIRHPLVFIPHQRAKWQTLHCYVQIPESCEALPPVRYVLDPIHYAIFLGHEGMLDYLFRERTTNPFLTPFALLKKNRLKDAQGNYYHFPGNFYSLLHCSLHKRDKPAVYKSMQRKLRDYIEEVLWGLEGGVDDIKQYYQLKNHLYHYRILDTKHTAEGVDPGWLDLMQYLAIEGDTENGEGGDTKNKNQRFLTGLAVRKVGRGLHIKEARAKVALHQQTIARWMRTIRGKASESA